MSLLPRPPRKASRKKKSSGGLGVPGIDILNTDFIRYPAAFDITEAARTFLSALSADQAAKACHPFDDWDERSNWHYTPIARRGLPLKEMNSTQRALAFALLSAGLSRRGFIKAMNIISLEEVLLVLEQGKGPVRDPDLYFVTIFGEPTENGKWAYRFEGHHVSAHFTIVRGMVTGSPSFFGANPAMIREGPRAGLRTLRAEEDLARELVHSLNPDDRETAVIDKTAYPDILTKNSRVAALNGDPSGLSYASMGNRSKELLRELLEEYVCNVHAPCSNRRREQIEDAGEIYFAWAGGLDPGQPHYYRVQTKAFLIEYDNTQNDSNHIHSVWRDFDGDFGRDLLKDHYRSSHGVA